MSEFEWFIYILEISFKKHGKKKLSNIHLLNIAKLASRQYKIQELSTWSKEELENLFLIFQQAGFNPEY
jgi:hypothetical protein